MKRKNTKKHENPCRENTCNGLFPTIFVNISFPDLGQTIARHDQQNLRLQHVHRVPFPDDEPVNLGAVHLVHRALLLYLKLYAYEWILRGARLLDAEYIRSGYYCWHCMYYAIFFSICGNLYYSN